jgi:ectoine hydroxylase-related dioxygenase (phytanoyl-CoA dioxygenase family)
VTPCGFDATGYAVVPDVLPPDLLAIAAVAADELLHRCRAGDPAVTGDTVEVSEVTARFPARNPGVDPRSVPAEPFIVGDLLRHDRRFAQALFAPRLWQLAAACLQVDVGRTVFHFGNLTVKPAHVGPAVGWHRDAENTYFASAQARTVRVLLPLDAMSAANGGTACAAGSHLRPSERNPLTFDLHYPAVPAGAALVLHARLLHGGEPNRSALPRRVLVVQFGVRGDALAYSANEVGALATHAEWGARAR